LAYLIAKHRSVYRSCISFCIYLTHNYHLFLEKDSAMGQRIKKSLFK